MSLNFDDAYPSKWIRAGDLGTDTHRVTIKAVEITEFQDGTTKPSMTFEGRAKGMVLNKTNATTIADRHGKDMLTWAGKDIEIFAQTVQGPNGMVPGIRLRCVGPAPVGGVAAVPDSDLNDDIPF